MINRKGLIWGGATVLVAVSLYLGHSTNESTNIVSSPSQFLTQDRQQLADAVRNEATPAAAEQPSIGTIGEDDQAIEDDKTFSQLENSDTSAEPLSTAAYGFDPLAQHFATEPRDQTWSSDVEGQIMARISDSGIAANLVEVECRSTQCRVALWLPEPLTDESPFMVETENGGNALALGRDLGMPTMFIFRGQDDDGSYVFRTYLLRNRQDSSTQSIAPKGATA